MYVLGGKRDGSGIWVHAKHVGDVEWILGLCVQPGPVQAGMDIWVMNELTEDHSFSFSLK